MPPELRTPPAPASLAYLLSFFAEIGSARTSGMSSPDPISWRDIDAWCSLTQTALAPWEARVLRLLDAAWLSAWRDGQPMDRS